MEKRSIYTNNRARTVKRFEKKCISHNSLKTLKLHSKPRCPWCNEALVFLYGEPGIGTISLRCSNCRRIALIDIASSTTAKIVEE